MQVEAAIDEADVGRLRVGQRATLHRRRVPATQFRRRDPPDPQGAAERAERHQLHGGDLRREPGPRAAARHDRERAPSRSTGATTCSRSPTRRCAFARRRRRGRGQRRRAGAPARRAAPRGRQRGARQRARAPRRGAEARRGAARQARRIFEDARAKFMRAARPAGRRRAALARRQIRVELRARITEILRPAQRESLRAADRRSAAPAVAPSAARLWVLEDGAPKPVDVRIGLSDGTSTEIVSGDAGRGRRGHRRHAGQAAQPAGTAAPRMRLF